MSVTLESMSVAATRCDPPNSPVTVVICESTLESSHALARALRRAPGVEVAGVTATGEQLERLVRRRLPDVVLVDLDGPGSDGIGIARRVRSASPTTKVAMLTRGDANDRLYDALKAGATGHANRRSGPAGIAAAVGALATGRLRLPSHLAADILHDLEAAIAMYLTATERALLEAVAQGLSGDEVTESLRLDVDVVHRTVDSILTKLYFADLLDLEAPNRWPATATNLAASAPCPSPIGRGQ